MSDRQQALSPFSAGRGTPGRMPYAQHPDPRELDGQRVMQSPSYALAGAIIPPLSMMDVRPQSSGSNMGMTSSLSGAVGEMDIPPQLRNPSSYPTKTRLSFSSGSQSSWTPGQGDMGASVPPFSQDRPTEVHQRPQLPSQSNISFTNPLIQGSNSALYSNHPGVVSRSPPFASTFTNQMPFQQGRSQIPPMVARPASQMSDQPRSRPAQDAMEEEIKMLRKKVRELELVNEHGRMRIKELESELAGGSAAQRSLRHSDHQIIPPSLPQTTPAPASIQMSWKARTDARVRLFCSLNRAGNALCSWHDSRRERRAYPPRMAPPGSLNCGCTYEEALFEESLSRHGVGSYHPGETVRMDPALRNPLLHLLQERYGYRDGDFERDPVTGEWTEGEGHLAWEQKLAAGALTARKVRGEERH
ncbi:hypothetical protein HYDPIDRAFT_168213 [Hydnomerulius pinastri MD-312]|uniref:Uncharacterized protein n=1 Tax=Hydnomerulius pinastri MD-312 TaxID=994086 RepID=A0A0C9VE06_9AGAM|nr:hypothetical protein HYDPIDRAFT_168213 [Hydnomerulius pinastri MD-312]